MPEQETVDAGQQVTEPTPVDESVAPAAEEPSYDKEKHILVNRDAFEPYRGDYHAALGDAKLARRLKAELAKYNVTPEQYFDYLNSQGSAEPKGKDEEPVQQQAAPTGDRLTVEQINALLDKRESDAEQRRQAESLQKAEEEHRNKALEECGFKAPENGAKDRGYWREQQLYNACINEAIKEMAESAGVRPNYAVPASKDALKRADEIYKEISSDNEQKAVARAAAKVKGRPTATLGNKGTGGAAPPVSRAGQSAKEFKDSVMAGISVPDHLK